MQLFRAEVASPHATRRSLVTLYALLIASNPRGGPEFWGPVNKAIGERLGLGLNHRKIDRFRKAAWDLHAQACRESPLAVIIPVEERMAEAVRLAGSCRGNKPVAVQYWRNTDPLAHRAAWRRFDALNRLAYERRRCVTLGLIEHPHSRAENLRALTSWLKSAKGYDRPRLP